MNILLELSKRNTEWLKMAYNITKSSDKAKDLVQDMYVKMADNDTELRVEYTNFIYKVMANIHKNQFRDNNTFVEDGERIKVQFASLDNNEIIYTKDGYQTNKNNEL